MEDQLKKITDQYRPQLQIPDQANDSMWATLNHSLGDEDTIEAPYLNGILYALCSWFLMTCFVVYFSACSHGSISAMRNDERTARRDTSPKPSSAVHPSIIMSFPLQITS
jgi:hypothetical protein